MKSRVTSLPWVTYPNRSSASAKLSDAATVGEYFRQEIPVIINLEDVDNAGATRIIDFVSGLILGRRGDIERLSRRTFLIVPAGAAILTTHDGLTDESFFNQALRRVNDSPVCPARTGGGICHSSSSTARSATLTSMRSSGSRRRSNQPSFSRRSAAG